MVAIDIEVVRTRHAVVDHGHLGAVGPDGSIPVEGNCPAFSYDYRTLGLGYANIGGLLMASGMALR